LFLNRCSKLKASSLPQKEATEQAVSVVILDSSAMPPDTLDRNPLAQAAEPRPGETAAAQGAVTASREASCDPHLQELTGHGDGLLGHSRLKWRGKAVLATEQEEGERLLVRDCWPGRDESSWLPQLSELRQRCYH